MRLVLPKANASSGFSLVELLVASVILAVGLLSMLAIFPQAYRNTRVSGSISSLNHLATKKTEQLRSIPYNHVDLSIGVHPTLQSDSAGQKYYPIPGLDEDFSVRWTVSAGPTDGAGNPQSNMKTVVIEATYVMRYSSGGAPIANDNGLEVITTTLITK